MAIPEVKASMSATPAQQRPERIREGADARRLQRADDEILGTEGRGIVGSRNFRGELGVTDAKRQAVRLDRCQMRPAHHAGDVVTGARKPHREMAADGARAENTDTHRG